MAKVHITNVVVLDNPSSFFNPFQFELTFECIEELREDLEWKMIYVGSAESEAYDQILDTIYVGPVPEGRHIFVFQADPPDVTRIPGKKKPFRFYFIRNQIVSPFPQSQQQQPKTNKFSKTFVYRTRCGWCNNSFVDMFVSWPRICSCRLFHKQ